MVAANLNDIRVLRVYGLMVCYIRRRPDSTTVWILSVMTRAALLFISFAVLVVTVIFPSTRTTALATYLSSGD